jgi:hypothetical protein
MNKENSSIELNPLPKRHEIISTLFGLEPVTNTKIREIFELMTNFKMTKHLI